MEHLESGSFFEAAHRLPVRLAITIAPSSPPKGLQCVEGGASHLHRLLRVEVRVVNSCPPGNMAPGRISGEV